MTRKHEYTPISGEQPTKREFERRLRANLRRYYVDGLGLTDWETRAERRIEEDLTIFPERIKKSIDHVGSLEGKRTLSVGSGWGGFAVAASSAGANAFGVEPDAEEVAISKLRAKVRNVGSEFILGVGEYLPFKDDSFDFIECVTVLEHVKEPENVISEMIRIVKPGGFVYILIPNYLYPFEQHYKIYWIPMLPKPLAKIYLTLRGRPPAFVDSLIYITPSRLVRALKRYDIEINNMTPTVNYQVTKIKSFKANLICICGKIFDMLGIKPTSEILIQKKQRTKPLYTIVTDIQYRRIILWQQQQEEDHGDKWRQGSTSRTSDHTAQSSLEQEHGSHSSHSQCVIS